jgi:MoxR-like ATPase
MFNKQIIDRWVKEAIKKKYTKEMLADLLRKNDFNNYELEEITNSYELLKSSKELNPSYKKDDSLNKSINEFSELIWKIKKEVGKVVIGQQDVLDDILCSLICNGHVLIEGVPGIAKTLLIKTISKVSGCSSKRIQFTADLLPTDITGITTYTPDKGFKVYKGPLFSNFVIADEINRSPPKTQSALLEAMQEKQVTIGRKRYDLPIPFFVLANNNPLESSGVYSLPEAQIDRFLFKLKMEYPEKNDEFDIIENNNNLIKFEDYDIKEILNPQSIVKMQELVKKIYVDKKIKNYILNIVFRTRKGDFNKGKYIEWGASPRASIGLFISAKARALIKGRNYVTPRDVKDIAFQILRHRIILNYRAQAENITSDDVIKEILDVTPS